MYEEIKEYLSEYLKLRRAQMRKTNEIAELRDSWTSVHTKLDGLPKGTTRLTMADYAAKLEELTDELQEISSDASEARRRIDWAIDQLPKESYQEVLHCKYVLGQDWGEIEEKTGYSRRHAMRLHREALACFKLS